MVLWVVGGVFGGALVMIAIGLGVGLSGQIDGTQQHGGAVSTISQICADIGRLVTIIIWFSTICQYLFI